MTQEKYRVSLKSSSLNARLRTDEQDLSDEMKQKYTEFRVVNMWINVLSI